MMFADSHCHINAEEFAVDRAEVVARAHENGVKYILDVSDDIARTPQIVDFCKKNKGIWTTVGVHPELADKYPDLSAEQIAAQAVSPYVVGIGECGLDYYYNSNIKDFQINVLKEQIKVSQEANLPLIIHNRDADDDMMEILSTAYRQKPFRGELHCFSSSRELCRFALDIGFYISASGIITFKKSEELRQIFAEVPLERLLIETDSPYLAPMPYRGKRNEPAYVVNTAKVLADIKKVSLEKMAEITTENFLRLFNKVRVHE
jgi:TatD DNase family protein